MRSFEEKLFWREARNSYIWEASRKQLDIVHILLWALGWQMVIYNCSWKYILKQWVATCPENVQFLDTLSTGTVWFGAQEFQLTQEKQRPCLIHLKPWGRMEMLQLTIERCEYSSLWAGTHPEPVIFGNSLKPYRWGLASFLNILTGWIILIKIFNHQ